MENRYWVTICVLVIIFGLIGLFLTGCGKMLPEGATFAKVARDAVDMRNCGMDIQKGAVTIEGNVEAPIIKADYHKHTPPKCDWYIRVTYKDGKLVEKYGNFERPWWVYALGGAGGATTGGSLVWLIVWFFRRQK